MTDLQWLDGYSGQTTDELLSLEGRYRTDSIVLAFEQALDQKYARVEKEGLSQEELVVLAVEALEREVNNGGYNQFFLNSSNEYAPVIVDALHRIGCSETADLTQRAIQALEIEGELTAQAIESAMAQDSQERNDRFNRCDDQYYEKAGDLAGALLEFIKGNRSRIDLG